MTASTPATPDPRVELVRRHLMASPGIHMPGQDPAQAALASLAAELAATRQALEQIRQILHECLWDEDFWQPEDLVELMERVYVLAGGDMSRAVLAGEDTT